MFLGLFDRKGEQDKSIVINLFISERYTLEMPHDLHFEFWSFSIKLVDKFRCHKFLFISFFLVLWLRHKIKISGMRAVFSDNKMIIVYMHSHTMFILKFATKCERMCVNRLLTIWQLNKQITYCWARSRSAPHRMPFYPFYGCL